jgi:hypothetical protein
VTTPGDESRTELAWREIVEHYGERVRLSDDEPSRADTDPRAGEGSEAGSEPSSRPAAGPGRDASGTEPLPDHLVDEDEVEIREEAIAAAERFRPPPPPPFPLPRTWQRGVAWAGIFIAPLLGLLIGLLHIYVASLLGWAIVAWFVGGFLYLVIDMPRSPRDPWDDGSRI